MPGLALYGGIEIEYYQLTPLGAQRYTTGNLKGISPTLKPILKDLYELGGTAELDELKFRGSNRNPLSLKVGLAKLVDLGYVLPVQMDAQQGAQGPQTVAPQRV